MYFHLLQDLLSQAMRKQHRLWQRPSHQRSGLKLLSSKWPQLETWLMLGAELPASSRHSNKLSCIHQDHRQVQSYHALMLCTQYDPRFTLSLMLLLDLGLRGLILQTEPTVYCCELFQDALNPSGLKSQLAELQHNNSILKRAVAIQNNRIQDLSSREAESQQLKQVVAQLQEKCHGLEMNNYSLAMHLRHATDNGSQNQQGQRHPDVY